MNNKQFISWQEAQSILAELSSCKENAKVQLLKTMVAVGCIAAVDILAVNNVPGFNRSSVDGYAVIHGDTMAASESCPAILQVCGESLIGEKYDKFLQRGQAVAVATGAMVPSGADAVVMIEHTVGKSGNDTVAIIKPVRQRENVVLAVEDCAMGEKLLRAGEYIDRQRATALIAAGVDEVSVRQRPRAAIFSTGNELIASGQQWSTGKIYDVNSFILEQILVNSGFAVENHGIVGDDRAALRLVLEKASNNADIVLFSGGSSIGWHDLSAKALTDVGGRILFDGVAVKPGRPTLCAKIGDKPLICLPGHPLALQVTMRTLLQPLLHKLCGRVAGSEAGQWLCPARLTRSVASELGRDDFVLMRCEKNQAEFIYDAEPLILKSGLIIKSLVAQAFLHIPSDITGFERGEMIWLNQW